MRLISRQTKLAPNGNRRGGDRAKPWQVSKEVVLLAQVQGQTSGDARKALKRSIEIKLVDQFGEG